MACPYFFPTEPRVCANTPQQAMLPLGGTWTGFCRAVPEGVRPPEDAIVRSLCNLGYARGNCSRFPSDAGPDAVRFTISRDDGEALKLYYVVERDHHPFSHGPLEYSMAREAFADPSPGETICRQANAYVQSYLRRKMEASRS
jgi:hypothetical protein